MEKTTNSICLTFLLLQITVVSIAQITVTANTSSIGRYDVYELTIQHPISYANNWEDVTVSTVFSGPQTINVDGFYYNAHEWRVRFAPPQTGNWTYELTFTTPSNTFTANGTFTCITSTTKGFLQRHPSNPFRLIFPDGTLFNGIGIGDCIIDVDGNGTPLNDWGFDGDTRPPSPPQGEYTTLDTYMNVYGSNGAGFNIFRWSIDNCAFNLYNTLSTSGNTYLVQQGIWGDSLVQSLRQNNIRLWTTFFGFNPPFPDFTGNTSQEEDAIERYIRYVVARYGAYVDIWELYNEATTSDHWIYEVVPFLNSIDPYNRMVAVSWEKPTLSVIDINAPHWYEEESEFISDLRSWDMITTRKSINKPIIFGEQGNGVQNYTPASALRMRLRSWTAFFAEGMFIFWNSSFAKDYFSIAANIYLGPDERGYIRALQDFTSLADSAIQQMTIVPSNPQDVRAYGLQSPFITMGYFHHYSSHTGNVTSTFDLTMPHAGTIYWLSPANDSIIQTESVSSGLQSITTPLFNIDLAFRTSAGPSGNSDVRGSNLNIQVYPNPFFSETTLHSDSGLEDATLIVYNSFGQIVKQITNISGQAVVLSRDDLASGLYFFWLTDENKAVAAGKLVIYDK